MDISLSNLFAALALVVSLAAFWNSYLARRQTQTDKLDELRRAGLTKVRELEIEWQGVLNELYHCSLRVEKAAPQAVRSSVLEWLSQNRVTFEGSHKHVVEMRQNLERGFEQGTLEEARRYLREFDGMSASLTATRAELTRRLNLLVDNAV